MGQPAARISDNHTCPMVTPGVPPIPHVGGPVTGPGCPTVMIGKMPAAVMGDMCVCVGPPDTIVKGSSGVFIGGKPAARVGDMTAHGGVIAGPGCPTVMIGEAGGAGGGGLASTPVSVLLNVLKNSKGAFAQHLAQATALKLAAENGNALAHNVSKHNPKTCPVCSKKK